MRREQIALRLLFILLFTFTLSSGFGNIISPSTSNNSTLSDFECKGDVLFIIPLRDTIDLFASMFLIKAPWSDLEFTVKVKDSNRKEYYYITAETESPIRYTVTEIKTGKSCTGRIDIKKELPRDCYSPKLHFTPVKDVTIQCLESTLPHDRGLPIPSFASNGGQAGTNGYNIRNWDSCGIVLLTYKDWVQDGSCQLGYDRLIDRTWTVINAAGRKTMTNEKIRVEFSTLEDLDSLRNYDGIDLPPLECDHSWPRLSSGTPDPNFTGWFYPKNFNCSNLEFIFEDSIIWNKNCQTPDVVYRKWIAYDWCRSMVRKQTQIIDIINCLPDTISPQARCNRDFSINLLINQQVSLGIDAFNNGSKDNCNIESISFNRNKEQDYITFYAKDVNKDSIVTIFVKDHIGNIDSCSTAVNILPYDGMGVGVIGGMAYGYDLKPIVSSPTITYQLSEHFNMIDFDHCSNPVLHPDLSFSLCLNDLHLHQLDFKLKLSAEDKFVGRSVLDLILIENHLLGKKEFNSFGLRAADVNCNKSVSTADISSLRKILLGKDSLSKWCNDKWVFVEPDEKEIKEITHFTIPHLPKYDLDYVPILLGDVNGSGLGHFSNAEISDSSKNDVFMNIKNRNFKAGDEYTIWLEVLHPVDMEGIQFSLFFDPDIMEIYEIYSPQMAFDIGHYRIQQNGEIRVSYYNRSGKSDRIKGQWLAFKARAKRNGDIVSALRHESSPLAAEVVLKDNQLAQLKIMIDGRGHDVVCMTMPNIDLIAGNEYEVWMSSNPSKEVIGFQMGIKYDTALIEIIEASMPNRRLDISNYNSLKNEFRLIKFDLFNQNDLDGKWIKLKIKAKMNGKLKDANFRSITELPNRLVNRFFTVVPFIIKIEERVSSVNIYNKIPSIIIYPNPSMGDVHLTHNSQFRQKSASITLYNSLGEIVYEAVYSSYNKDILIPKEAFPADGLYLVVYKTDSRRQVIKLVRN